MRLFVHLFAAAALVSVVPVMPAQQPKVVHTQLTTEAGGQGLNAVLHNLKSQNNPQWGAGQWIAA